MRNTFSCLLLCAAAGSIAAADTADVLFTGGEILTMRGATPEYVESLAVKDGKILFAGPLADGRTFAGPATKTVDLAGKTLLPGFIDTHGHFVYFGKNLVDANLFGCTDIDDLVARMKKQAERTPADGWIVGFGYQARGLKEGRHPTSAELDRVSADRPVMVVDSSGHLGAANPAAVHGRTRRAGHHRSRRGVGEPRPDHGDGGRPRPRQRRHRHRAQRHR